MKPGPELDEKVARLLGWEPKIRHEKGYTAEDGYDYKEYPPVSTDPFAMMRALEAMRERGWTMSSGLSLLDYIVEAVDPQGGSVRKVGDTLMHAVALAICAALEGRG